MNHAMHLQSSYAALFDPAVALAVAKRAEQWNLPRHICHPLDRHPESRKSTELSAFDTAVDLAPLPEEEIPDDQRCATCGIADAIDSELDGEEYP